MFHNFGFFLNVFLTNWLTETNSSELRVDTLKKGRGVYNTPQNFLAFRAKIRTEMLIF